MNTRIWHRTNFYLSDSEGDFHTALVGLAKALVEAAKTAIVLAANESTGEQRELQLLLRNTCP